LLDGACGGKGTERFTEKAHDRFARPQRETESPRRRRSAPESATRAEDVRNPGRLLVFRELTHELDVVW
jgi:hypothetical protein